MLPSGCASQSAARRGGPSSLSARSNADTRGVTGCAKLIRILAALIGVCAPPAPATGTHAPSATSTQISTATPSRTMTTSRLLGVRTFGDASVVDDEGMQRVVPQLVAAVEERELDQERHAHDLASELLDQPERRSHRPARGEPVVDGEHALPRLHRVLVDRERVAPVLELVLDPAGLPRPLAPLPPR